MTMLTNTNDISIEGGDTMEYLIIGNTYVIEDGNVCDGWYIDKGVWRYDASLKDEPHYIDDDYFEQPMEGEYLIIDNEYIIGSPNN